MDLKVYKKETVSQPSGNEDIYVPDVIDIYPEIVTGEFGNEYLAGAEILEKDSDVLFQASALATIWQRGLDPLDEEDGNRWSELYLDEINVIQIMEDIVESVSSVSSSVTVDFDSVLDGKGNNLLSYKIKAAI